MNISIINEKIQSQKEILLQHSLYEKIKTIDDLHQFLENHVYAVWDFMSLLKALQSKLTCTTTPWFATQNSETRYLINEIVLAEESDLTLDGKRLSHFEMYVEAMKSCGAKTSELDTFLQNVIDTKNVFIAIKQSFESFLKICETRFFNPSQEEGGVWYQGTKYEFFFLIYSFLKTSFFPFF